MTELTNEQKKELKKEAKEIINSTSEKTEWTKEEKINKIFDKIWFLQLSNEEKEETAKNIVENSQLDKLYFVEIVLSTFIVALWLLHNSTAVVIWWMLIAPLLRPINGLSFSIARWVWKTFWKSMFSMIISIFLSVFLSFLIAKIIWLWETSEISARTSPNLIDFFIAIFCGIFWVLALKFKRISESLSWVALAVSLLPPLCVIWIELAYGNNTAAFWASLLFLSNMLWIILVSTIFFWLFWFNPHDKKLQSKVLVRIFIFIFSVIIILVPLYLSSNEIFIKNKLNSDVWIFLEENLKEKIDNFKIKNIKILENSWENLKLEISLKVYEEKNLENIFKEIKKKAEKKYKKNVEIEFDLIKFLKI